MVVELLRPQRATTTSAEEALHRLTYIKSPRMMKSIIHPPHPRVARRIERVEPTSALELATELFAGGEIDPTALELLAVLAASQLPQGPASERLKLFFTLSQLLSKPAPTDTQDEPGWLKPIGRKAIEAQEAHDERKATYRLYEGIAACMLSNIRPLFHTIAPTLRWTTLASLATVLDQPYFTRTSRKFGVGQLCALLPEALEDAAAHDKATVYSILYEMRERGHIEKSNTLRIVANLTEYLSGAIRNTNVGLRRQLLELHIALLESRRLKSLTVIRQVQAIVREHAASVAESLEGFTQRSFDLSVRRALV
jgi:hypothetical protein